MSTHCKYDALHVHLTTVASLPCSGQELALNVIMLMVSKGAYQVSPKHCSCIVDKVVFMFAGHILGCCPPEGELPRQPGRVAAGLPADRASKALQGHLCTAPCPASS